MIAHVPKNVRLAGELSDGAKAALRAASFDDTRWVFQALEAEVLVELIALKLARPTERWVQVTILGISVRAIVVRPK